MIAELYRFVIGQRLLKHSIYYFYYNYYLRVALLSITKEHNIFMIFFLTKLCDVYKRFNACSHLLSFDKHFSSQLPTYNAHTNIYVHMICMYDNVF